MTSTDYVAALLERGRARAAKNLPVTFQEADAEALPFADSSFDVVLSTFGVMFTPNQEQAAQELLRVCRSGDRLDELDARRLYRSGISHDRHVYFASTMGQRGPAT